MSIIITTLFLNISYPNTDTQIDSTKKHESDKIRVTNISNKTINQKLSTSEKIIAEKERLTSGATSIDKNEDINTKKNHTLI